VLHHLQLYTVFLRSLRVSARIPTCARSCSSAAVTCGWLPKRSRVLAENL
jgi:hypothetical protein